MRLGIDFGTTRIVVSAADAGNYPVLAFEDAEGTYREWYPPLVAIRGQERRYGWHAHALQADPEWTVLRSLKRMLEASGPLTLVEVGQGSFSLTQLLAEMCSALHRAIREASTLPEVEGPAEVLAGVPASAHSNQRFLTIEALRQAGFQVIGLANEPAAAAVEYSRFQHPGVSGEQILVYDLGGGTFDAALVSIDPETQTVVASDGVNDVGGDDFDEVLAAMVLEQSQYQLTLAEHFRLLEECRAKKEALNANSRRIAIDLSTVRDGLPVVNISVTDFYGRCRPLVDRTVEATSRLMDTYDTGQRLAALYITGGGSDLPLVARVLRETFGRRVKRSAYARSATAIGLAVQADAHSPSKLQDRFNRYFGVWREAEAGAAISFDTLFPKGTRLPLAGEPPLTVVRSYQPVHNVGHFRYFECAHLSPTGQPAGHITAWDEVTFPFDGSDSEGVSRGNVTGAQQIEETYTCDSSGMITVCIENKTAGFRNYYQLAKDRPS